MSKPIPATAVINRNLGIINPINNKNGRMK
jgi:hypothetical protein